MYLQVQTLLVDVAVKGFYSVLYRLRDRGQVVRTWSIGDYNGNFVVNSCLC